MLVQCELKDYGGWIEEPLNGRELFKEKGVPHAHSPGETYVGIHIVLKKKCT